MDSDTNNSWAHTIGAVFVSVIAFFVLLYFVAPIIESLLNLHGRLFVPERFGGGDEVDNPGILTLAFRAILASSFSAVGALMAGGKLFSRAHTKSVAIVFSTAIVIWAGSFAYAGLSSGAVLMPVLIAGLGGVPPIVVAYWVWQDGL